MARYREEAEKAAMAGALKIGVETIDKACPICKFDVKGDDIYLFYCKKCNLLFKRDELFLENPERLRGIVEKTIINKYERDKDKIKIEDELITLKDIKIHREKKHHTVKPLEGKQVFEAKLSEKHLYVASKSSNKLHIASCPFAKNIKKSNREQFHSLKDAKKHKNYKHCKCIE
jgi:hypothetical protein